MYFNTYFHCGFVSLLLAFISLWYSVGLYFVYSGFIARPSRMMHLLSSCYLCVVCMYCYYCQSHCTLQYDVTLSALAWYVAVAAADPDLAIAGGTPLGAGYVPLEPAACRCLWQSVVARRYQHCTLAVCVPRADVRREQLAGPAEEEAGPLAAAGRRRRGDQCRTRRKGEGEISAELNARRGAGGGGLGRDERRTRCKEGRGRPTLLDRTDIGVLDAAFDSAAWQQSSRRHFGKGQCRFLIPLN